MFVLSEDEKWYRVSLRLMGDDLPVEEIEARLGLAAASFGRKGEHLNDNPRHEKYQTNVWVSKRPTNSDVPFEEQIAGLLDLLELKVDALKAILSFPNVEGELFLGFGSGNGQGGAYFSPKLLARIAQCNLSLGLDLYPPSIDEDEEA